MSSKKHHNKAKQTRRAEEWARQSRIGKSINWDNSKSLLGGLFALAASIVALYEAINYFRGDPETFYWIIIPILAGVASLGLLIQAFRKKNPIAYAWLAVGLLVISVALIGWKSYTDTIKSKLVVAIANFDGPEDIYGLRNQILEQLTQDFSNSPEILVVPISDVITPDKGSPFAHRLGEKHFADLVIWGWYRPTENPNVNIHIENLSAQQFSTPLLVACERSTLKPKISITDLESFSFQQQLSGETSGFISMLVGLLKYQYADYSSAVTFFDKSINSIPTSSPFHSNLAPIYFYRGASHDHLENNEQAIADYSAAIEIEPQFATALFSRGQIYFHLNEFEQAIIDFNAAIQIDTKSTIAYAQRGNAYAIVGKHEKAIDDFTKAIQINPEAYLYNNRGLSYDQLRQYAQALKDYDKAIALDSELGGVYYNRGNTNSDLKEFEKAIADYSKSLEFDAKYPCAYNNRGTSHLFLKQYDEAIQDYTKAIQLDNQFALAYGNRGVVYYILQQNEQAVIDLTKAIQLDPTYAGAYSNRGKVYIKLEQYDKAIADFSMAIQIEPEEADAYKERGQVYQKLGKSAEAEADLKRYEELTGEKP